MRKQTCVLGTFDSRAVSVLKSAEIRSIVYETKMTPKGAISWTESRITAENKQ